MALAVIALLDVLDGAGFTAVGGWPVDLLNALGIVVVVLLPLAFLAGTLMGGFPRSGELVRRLGDAPVGPAQLGAAVAYALGDPSAEIIYRLSDERRYVDASGAAVDPDPSRALEEVTHGGRRVGAIVYDPVLLGGVEPVRSIARVVGLSLDHERLTAELRPASASYGPPGRGSRRRPTPSAAASHATSTTARSSGSSCSRSRATVCDGGGTIPTGSALPPSSCARASTRR
jgi:hypothetical protein